MPRKKSRGSRSRVKARGSRKHTRTRPAAARTRTRSGRKSIDPGAPAIVPDADVLEVLRDTQMVAAENTPDRKIVGEDVIDKKRGTILTGGDVDAAWDEVNVGEETVGGSTPTPDQDVVDDLGRAAGVTYADTEPLRPEEKEAERDEKRWEVDPASSEDYPERVRAVRERKRRKR